MRAPVPVTSPPYPVPASPLVRDDVGLHQIDAKEWDGLAPGHPLLSHAFLSALHETGCATERTGWRPRYLTAWQAARLAGAMPLYAKTHSYGEYVFDWGWADAYRRHGLRYYPKLVSAIPFTPVPGPRLLAASPTVCHALLSCALALVKEEDYSSLHLLFTDDEQTALGLQRGMIERTGIQFHWRNAGYDGFDAFLADLAREKRKNIRQERRKLEASGVTFRRKCGDEITADDWALFFRCYRATYREHRSTPYLSLPFFERLGATMPQHLLMVVGERGGRAICAALDVFTPQTLWGRYWGTLEDVPGLHFEACYYQAIEFCIERGIDRFEGGAQGAHKLARGLLPVTTRSLHAIGDASFAAAVARYCERERDEVASSLDELALSNPFRNG